MDFLLLLKENLEVSIMLFYKMTLHQHKRKTHYTYSPSPSELHHVVLDVRALSHVLNVHDLKVFRGDIVLIKNSLKYLILT